MVRTKLLRKLVSLQKSTDKLLLQSKEMSTDIGKVRLSPDGLKYGVKLLNKLFTKVDTSKPRPHPPIMSS